MAPKIELIAASFFRQARRPLVQKSDDVIAALWTAPCAILAQFEVPVSSMHFANRCALDVYETDYLDFSARLRDTPSHGTGGVSANGLFSNHAPAGGITKHSGDLISCRGNRFRVQQALTWLLLDEAGACHGHAAMFDLWIALD